VGLVQELEKAVDALDASSRTLARQLGLPEDLAAA
jgi:hypothetical protein